ncbi:MAG: copper resistance protein CopC [Actinomycetes bacterium]
MHRNIALAATAAMVFLLSVLMAPTGSAHADLQVSTPEDGESLEVAPEEIRLTFSEELFEELVEISILDAAGDLYSTIGVEQTPPPGTGVIFPWPPQAPPGEYSIAYRVVSADGHPVTGTVSFSYAAHRAGAERAGAEFVRQHAVCAVINSCVIAHRVSSFCIACERILDFLQHRFIVGHALCGNRCCAASRRHRRLGDHCSCTAAKLDRDDHNHPDTHQHSRAAFAHHVGLARPHRRCTGRGGIRARPRRWHLRSAPRPR